MMRVNRDPWFDPYTLGVAGSRPIYPKETHMDTKNTTETLDHLMQTLEDGAKGFTDAADKLGDITRPDIATAFRGFADQRTRFHSELKTLSLALGHEPEEKGTVAATLHRSWMGIKDLISGKDPDGVLDAAEQGEDHAVSVYRKACDEELPADVRTVVERQLAAINVSHEAVKQLRNAA